MIGMDCASKEEFSSSLAWSLARLERCLPRFPLTRLALGHEVIFILLHN